MPSTYHPSFVELFQRGLNRLIFLWNKCVHLRVFNQIEKNTHFGRTMNTSSIDSLSQPIGLKRSFQYCTEQFSILTNHFNDHVNLTELNQVRWHSNEFLHLQPVLIRNTLNPFISWPLSDRLVVIIIFQSATGAAITPVYCIHQGGWFLSLFMESWAFRSMSNWCAVLSLKKLVVWKLVTWFINFERWSESELSVAKMLSWNQNEITEISWASMGLIDCIKFWNKQAVQGVRVTLIENSGAPLIQIPVCREWE